MQRRKGADGRKGEMKMVRRWELKWRTRDAAKGKDQQRVVRGATGARGTTRGSGFEEIDPQRIQRIEDVVPRCRAMLIPPYPKKNPSPGEE